MVRTLNDAQYPGNISLGDQLELVLYMGIACYMPRHLFTGFFFCISLLQLACNMVLVHEHDVQFS